LGKSGKGGASDAKSKLAAFWSGAPASLAELFGCADCAAGKWSAPSGAGTRACSMTSRKLSLVEGGGGGELLEKEASNAETPLALGAGV